MGHWKTIGSGMYQWEGDEFEEERVEPTKKPAGRKPQAPKPRRKKIGRKYKETGLIGRKKVGMDWSLFKDKW